MLDREAVAQALNDSDGAALSVHASSFALKAIVAGLLAINDQQEKELESLRAKLKETAPREPAAAPG